MKEILNTVANVKLYRWIHNLKYHYFGLNSIISFGIDCIFHSDISIRLVVQLWSIHWSCTKTSSIAYAIIAMSWRRFVRVSWAVNRSAADKPEVNRTISQSCQCRPHSLIYDSWLDSAWITSTGIAVAMAQESIGSNVNHQTGVRSNVNLLMQRVYRL